MGEAEQGGGGGECVSLKCREALVETECELVLSVTVRPSGGFSRKH